MNVAFAKANLNQHLITNLFVYINSSPYFRYTTPLLFTVLIHV